MAVRIALVGMAQPELLITQQQVRDWMSVAGFDVTQEFDLFDDKFFVVFTKRE